MITLLIAITALIVAYFTHGKYVEKYFRKLDRQTPAYVKSNLEVLMEKYSTHS